MNFLSNRESRGLARLSGIPETAHPAADLRNQFTEIFFMQFDDFYNYVTGFDIAKLAGVLDPDELEGISLRDIIAAKYSDPAADLIEKLLNYPDLDNLITSEAPDPAVNKSIQ